MTKQDFKVSLESAQLTMLLEIDGRVHLVGVKKDRLQAIEMIAKASAEFVMPTERSQMELNDFLGYEGVKRG